MFGSIDACHASLRKKALKPLILLAFFNLYGCADSNEKLPQGYGGRDLSCSVEQGAYCFDSATLGVCKNGQIVPSRTCRDGCKTNNQGISDACKSVLGCRVPNDEDDFFKKIVFPFKTKQPCNQDPEDHIPRTRGRRNWDLECSTGDKIVAPVSGEIVNVQQGWSQNGCGGTGKGYGNYVCIKDGSGDVVCLNHLDEVYAEEGCTVVAGQEIGTCGNTGYSCGDHLDIYATRDTRTGSNVELSHPTYWSLPTQTMPWSCGGTSTFDRPINQTPADGQAVSATPLPIRFSWSAVAGNPEAYRVVITDKLSLATAYYNDSSKADDCLTDADPQKRCLVSARVTNTFYDLNQSLALDTTLYWVVRAGSSDRGGLFSSPTSFQLSNTTTQPCQGKADGLWCGQALGLDADTLYECAAGQHSVNQTCSDGCDAQAQKCATPQAARCPFGNGLYCGDADGRDARNLYRCDNGRYTLEQRCSDGCQGNGNGTNDSCKAAMSACPSGDGLYCGSTLGLDRQTLYNCQGGQSAVFEQCIHGCKEAPTGQNDSCNPPPACNNQCTNIGQTRCFGAAQYQTCQADAQGCLDWSNANSCPTNQTCNANTQQCEDQRECTNEGAVLQSGSWSACNYATQCAQSAERTRMVTRCTNGKRVNELERDTQGCNRNTDGTVISQGSWSSCAYNSTCAEQGSRTRQTTTCTGGQQTTMTSTDTCNRDTDGQSCGGQQVCQSGQCACQSQHSKQCYNDDVYWYNSCNQRESRYQSCADGCNQGRCLSCTNTCHPANPSTRNPTNAETSGGGGQVMQLNVQSTSNCNALRLRATKANGTFGDGTYDLRVGTCRDVGVIRATKTISNDPSYIDFTTDFRGAPGQTKIFCLTKRAPSATYSPDAWFWSNIVEIDMRRTCQ